MWTAVVFFLLISLGISENRISTLKERGTRVIRINRLSSEKHCRRACRGLSLSGNRYCNWSVFYQNRCVLLHCCHLYVCQNASTQDITDLLGELVLKKREAQPPGRTGRQVDSDTSQENQTESRATVPPSPSAQVRTVMTGPRTTPPAVIKATTTQSTKGTPGPGPSFSSLLFKDTSLMVPDHFEELSLGLSPLKALLSPVTKRREGAQLCFQPLARVQGVEGSAAPEKRLEAPRHTRTCWLPGSRCMDVIGAMHKLPVS
ncbi:uncharacterized protein C11orf24 homolog isoform X3 [Caretta caretta]|uniref:uncharacterized protein C11orf24 homolog isoform X3 n=1 Tax=Caretta caretta TaxID=8467 RepID=UPI00209436C8|nr:uncharacterized protein C11orf24 homolog isoform X3 [Caretta caretta]